jgi:hypothetical protein
VQRSKAKEINSISIAELLVDAEPLELQNKYKLVKTVNVKAVKIDIF